MIALPKLPYRAKEHVMADSVVHTEDLVEAASGWTNGDRTARGHVPVPPARRIPVEHAGRDDGR